MGASHRLYQYLRIIRDLIVAPMDALVAGAQDLYAQWQSGGMTAALAAWPKAAGKYEGIDFATADIAALVAFLQALNALVTTHAAILTKLRAVK